jgi:uncharacterized protein
MVTHKDLEIWKKGIKSGQVRQMTVNVDVLAEVVRRIVEVARPERIILFGSAACGAMGPNSDLDLLVIVRRGVHRRHLAQKIYQHLIGVGFPIDIVVATSEDIERYGQAIGLVLEPALREGKVLYEGQAMAAG